MPTLILKQFVSVVLSALLILMKLIRKLFEQFDAVLHILCSHYHFHTLAQKATTPSTEVQLTWISNHFCLFDARSEICNAEVANVSNQLCLPVVQWWELPSSFHSYFLWRIFDWKDQLNVLMTLYAKIYMTNGSKVKT